jgi:probable HAF family extracellular repeat protein
MSFLTQPSPRTTPAVRALLLVAAAFAVASACNRPDSPPTAPPIAVSVEPRAVIVGANVTVLPFSARAINESGQVVGGRWLWRPNEGVQDLGTLGGTVTDALAISNAGQVAGWSYTGDGAQHAFLWTPGQGMQDLGTLGGRSSIARGINERGEVVGDLFTPGVGRRAFLWTPAGGMQNLGALGGDFTGSVAYDINNAGHIVGASIDELAAPGLRARPTLWAAGQGIQNLSSLAGPNGVAYAINDADQVVGESRTPSGADHAFLWAPGKGMQDLGALDFLNSVAFSINGLGQVVGVSDAALGGRHAFLWTAAGGMEDLVPATGIFMAFGINDQQQVVGDNRVATLQLASENRAPLASAGGPYAGNEGSAVTLAFLATDADGDALTYTWSFGDAVTGSGPTPPASHTYADNGTYAITLTVSDGKGGTDTKTTTATIANVAPAIAAGSLTGPAGPIQLSSGNASAPITLAFTDPAGARDTYAAQIQCGNGAALSPNGITAPYQGTCTYTSAGVYTVRATVADEDGGTSAAASYRYVVVYDPDGAFITGSGFYTVPGQGKRKAHFTFDAKFLTGRTTAPNGKAKFWIPGAQVDFVSTALEMLVVFGNRAQFWGTGTLNGGTARFRITAAAGQGGGSDGAGDAFRIELWRAGTLVFDTQPNDPQDAAVTTVIEAGSIRVHQE